MPLLCWREGSVPKNAFGLPQKAPNSAKNWTESSSNFPNARQKQRSRWCPSATSCLLMMHKKEGLQLTINLKNRYGTGCQQTTKGTILGFVYLTLRLSFTWERGQLENRIAATSLSRLTKSLFQQRADRAHQRSSAQPCTVRTPCMPQHIPHALLQAHSGF